MDQDLREICASRYADDVRISSAASLLVLARSGVHLQDEAILDMTDSLVRIAEEFNLQPEDIQAALTHSEPCLGAQDGLAL